MKKQTIIIGIVALAVILGGVCFAGLGEKQKEDQKEKQITETIPAPTIAEQKPADTSAADTSQSGKIDEHLTINNELRDVNFCGKTYKVKQVLIGGVDVAQRIAELAREDKKVSAFPQYKGTGEICNNILLAHKGNEELNTRILGPGKIEGADNVYSFGIANISFVIRLDKNTILEEVSGPEFPDPGLFGVFIPIGILK